MELLGGGGGLREGLTLAPTPIMWQSNWDLRKGHVDGSTSPAKQGGASGPPTSPLSSLRGSGTCSSGTDKPLTCILCLFLCVSQGPRITGG